MPRGFGFQHNLHMPYHSHRTDSLHYLIGYEPLEHGFAGGSSGGGSQSGGGQGDNTRSDPDVNMFCHYWCLQFDPMVGDQLQILVTCPTGMFAIGYVLMVVRTGDESDSVHRKSHAIRVEVADGSNGSFVRLDPLKMMLPLIVDRYDNLTGSQMGLLGPACEHLLRHTTEHNRATELVKLVSSWPNMVQSETIYDNTLQCIE
jgi:hypothetical protein